MCSEIRTDFCAVCARALRRYDVLAVTIVAAGDTTCLRLLFFENMAKKNEREAWTKVIDLFKDLPYLWDKNHKDYFNRDMRQEAFKMLVQIFNEEIGRDTSLADFKKKLENMRTTYGRELKKVRSCRI